MNPFIKLTTNINQSLPIITENSENSVDELFNELQNTIKNHTLQIMLYGSYNAGKSTLVNTLLGSYEAVENDIPTTDSVDIYNWNGFNLLDTPGVNAPIQHENITEEQVKRSGAMLFVIREGDQDVKDVYERLFSMLKLGKKIFIVLNHQLTDKKDKALALQKINQIISNLAPEYNIDKDKICEISILLMNIRTAYNGRIKQHDKLLQHSGYNDFINVFKHWAMLQDEDKSHLNKLKNQINECWYQPVIEKLESQVNVGETKEVRALRDDRLMLQNQKRSIKTSATHYINQQVNQLKPNISNVLLSSSSEIEIDSNLHQLFMPLIDNVETWLGDELQDVCEKLTVTIDKNAKMGENSVAQSPISDAFVNSTKEFISDEKNLKEALLFGRKLKIPGLKGRWEKTFDKWVGKAGPFIQVAIFFYDLHKADSDQDKENLQNRQHSMELYQCVDQISTTVVGDMISSVHEMVGFTFDNQINVIQQQLDNDCESNDNKKNSYNDLTKLQGEMLSISF